MYDIVHLLLEEFRFSLKLYLETQTLRPGVGVRVDFRPGVGVQIF